jgi:GNAT superfamily N-acetyltransferase
MPNGLQIRELMTDAEIASAYALMATLRPYLLPELFVGQVRRQQGGGYRLVGGFDEGVLVALAGLRDGCTLSRGLHVFVDDLVTDAGARGKGHGRAMLRWIAEDALKRGLPKIWLDSRATAKGFYEKVGFNFITAIPCWIDAAELE